MATFVGTYNFLDLFFLYPVLLNQPTVEVVGFIEGWLLLVVVVAIKIKVTASIYPTDSNRKTTGANESRIFVLLSLAKNLGDENDILLNAPKKN